MTFYKHMRREMQWPTTFIVAAGLIALIFAWRLTPQGPRPLAGQDYLFLVLCLITTAIIIGSKNIVVWRVSGVVQTLFIALLFEREVAHLGEFIQMWGMLTTTLIAMGMSILFVSTLDYLITLLAVWIIMWHVNRAGINPLSENIFYLHVAITTILGVCLNATYIKTMQKIYELMNNYKNLSQIDFLTKAPNRRSLMDAIQATIDECINTSSENCWFLMLDIDYFKNINDKLGHARGDDVLINLTQLIKEESIKHRFGRLGGEEFGILYKDCSEQDVLKSIESLLTSTQKYAPCPYSFSAGLTKINVNSDLSDILSQADQELYNAKREGRNRVHYLGSALYVTPMPEGA
ncbi:GGDEF domain-containing protein [Pseudomonas oryzihabitans]|uniref:GGDEF domain-containing protein n=1 Tax=Pseudomonas oryzihabitans TaxID=47885 RepID=UPI0028558702|nr:GGDEF domain-containing protein [Pseudomonas psychrotolerans]MDR6677609.1 diguanylate cyclase (GGDEF)-like protein [Pseudomonas psychrotolerans]